MILYGHPTGTRVRMEGKMGTMVNVAPFEVSKTFEILFDDGSKMLHTERVDLDSWKLIVAPIEDIERLKEGLHTKTRRVEELAEECGAISEICENDKYELKKEILDLKAQLDAERNPHRPYKTKVWTDKEKIVDITPDLGSPVSGPVKLATKVIEMLNEENVRKVLDGYGGSAKIAAIAEKTESSAHAVYRFLKKLTGNDRVKTDILMGKLSKPEFDEGDVDVWLEGQERVSEEISILGVVGGQEADKRKVTEVSDAPRSWKDTESPEQPTVSVDDDGTESRPQDEEE